MILLADDHPLVRTGLRQIIAEAYPEMQICEATTTPETLDALSRHNYKLLVLDIFMPGRSGLEVLQAVRQDYPSLPVLVVSSAPEEQLAVRVLKAGASGYLNKQAAPEELSRAVGKILSGGRYVSAAMAERLVADLGGRQGSGPELLSDREFTVLQLLLAGRTLKEISAELSLSVKTVSTYHTRIWKKLGVGNDMELVEYAIDHNLRPGAACTIC